MLDHCAFFILQCASQSDQSDDFSHHPFLNNLPRTGKRMSQIMKARRRFHDPVSLLVLHLIPSQTSHFLTADFYGQEGTRSRRLRSSFLSITLIQVYIFKSEDRLHLQFQVFPFPKHRTTILALSPSGGIISPRLHFAIFPLEAGSLLSCCVTCAESIFFTL
jgi:hypothetical protein